MNDKEQLIKEYVRKYATKHEISIEEAMNHKVVLEYIKYLEGK